MKNRCKILTVIGILIAGSTLFYGCDSQNSEKTSETKLEKSNEKSGVQKEYLDDGSKEEFYLKDGKKDGEAKRTYPNGDVEEFKYVAGIREGKATIIYLDPTENGIYKGTYTYINGQKNGLA